MFSVLSPYAIEWWAIAQMGSSYHGTAGRPLHSSNERAIWIHCMIHREQLAAKELNTEIRYTERYMAAGHFDCTPHPLHARLMQNYVEIWDLNMTMFYFTSRLGGY